MAAERTALFVRVPTVLAADLDARARTSGRSKQDLVTQLLEAGTIERDGANEAGVDRSDVLDLAEVAELLRLDQADVLERIARGDFPGRRFGSSWRFSLAAVLSWLAGTDPPAQRRTGFSGPDD